jgi:hypothetical protein
VETTAVRRDLGTLLEYSLSADIIPLDDDDLADARAAIELVRAAGPAYGRRPSPHWLDTDSFAETFATIEPIETTVRQVIERLDGCSGAIAGKLAEPYGKNRKCGDLSEHEIATLLSAVQSKARLVKPRSLGLIGANAFGEAFDAYIVAEQELRVGTNAPYARIPVLIEAWASVTTRRGGDARLRVFVNRTPAIGGAEAVRSSSGGIRLSGAGLRQWGESVRVEGGDCDLIIAATAPLIPTTSLGKQPDLSLLQSTIAEALRRAFSRSRNRLPADPATPKPPREEGLSKTPPPLFIPSGKLAVGLGREARLAGMQPSELLVLSTRHDPFSETKLVFRS